MHRRTQPTTQSCRGAASPCDCSGTVATRKLVPRSLWWTMDNGLLDQGGQERHQRWDIDCYEAVVLRDCRVAGYHVHRAGSRGPSGTTLLRSFRTGIVTIAFTGVAGRTCSCSCSCSGKAIGLTTEE